MKEYRPCHCGRKVVMERMLSMVIDGNKVVGTGSWTEGFACTGATYFVDT